jgi:tetratricopeptide (TPR) repeat protein
MRRPLRAQPALARITKAERSPRAISPTAWFRRPTLLLSLLLFLVTLAVYSRALRNSFVEYDDPEYVTENPHVQAGLTWQTVAWALTSTEQANWFPLTGLSHALDCQLFGLDPAGHHFTSLLFHSCNAVLLFLLLLAATGSPGRSLVVASLFALHPLSVESVAWVAERKNVLSTLFFLLTLGAYGWYACRPNVKRYVVVAFLFALALASKPMVVTLPCVLLLLDFWPLRRIQGWTPTSRRLPVRTAPLPRLVVEKLPLLGLSAACCVVTVIAQRAGGALRSLQDFSLKVRLENALNAIMAYVGKAIWPARLAPLYPHPGNTLPAWELWLAGIFLAGASALAWKQRNFRPYLAIGWLWYLGTLVPVLGLVQVGEQAMADRYTYVPLIGIFVMAVWGLADLADTAQFQIPRRVAAATAVLVILACLTWRQIAYWRTSYDLWSHTLAVTKDNYVAQADMATTLQDLGRFSEAVSHFREAARLHPQDAVMHVNLAAGLAQTGRLQEAIPQYKATIRLTTDPAVLATAYADLGTVYRHLGDYNKARENYWEALRIDPQQVHALQGLQQLATNESAQAISPAADPSSAR